MEKNSRTEMLPGKRDFYRCLNRPESVSLASLARQLHITRIMVTIKKRAGVILYSFSSSSIALLSSLLSCSFYLLDRRTISSVDIS